MAAIVVRRVRSAVPILALLTACTGAPLNYMYGAGPVASSLARLGWWLLIVSAVVVAVVIVLVVVGVLRGQRLRDDPSLARTAALGGLMWIYIGGLLIPAVILVISFGLTLGSLHATSRPSQDPATTIRIIGHRWWWEVHYIDRDPAMTIVTANEIHIPVGQPVRLELTSGDVIHSFWVPKLAGKTDVIPGSTNIAWLEADSAGVYRGHCTEYCGLQHTNMDPTVVAESPREFADWETAQRASAKVPTAAAAMAGLAVFQKSACATCHAIRGSDAVGRVGPDLTHLASRLTIAAGVLQNRRGNVAGWIANSQAIKPGNDMPVMTIAPNDFLALLAYLETLK